MSADDHARGVWHGTRRHYLTGLLLSVLLTAVPFWLVMGDVLDNRSAAALIITGLAAAQMIAHVVFFLHVSADSEAGWTLVSLLFTVIIVVITLAGTSWIIYHLDANMMPTHESSGLL